ncbi:hypothetical protein GPECTOR_1g268 [Gonium pectorale]|uniref:Bifunctional inhibitor/plant lipid transfer protein/seed storage helical domain-containing protein n=1 Tax=Gonium pectorale TaxID=33097 RepID=A0A150H2Q1_GONPE|nr:hypothetical protein GPECTOR_1g268 [Gonium pectorale]|eukprot:KXZ56304.1 hypothetical protein GPECTOR_1g268 [Gonium pectorale]
MNYRRCIAAGVLALVLVALVADPASAAIPKCEAVRSTITKDPAVVAFKACAGKKPISVECCRNLIPLAQYYDCLNDPGYQKEVGDFLKGTTTLAEVQKACLG